MSLERLSFQDNNFTAEGIREFLDLEASKDKPTLKVLDLSCNSTFKTEGAFHISRFLAKNSSSLLALNLSECWIDQQAVAYLCQGLRENATLRVLSLAGNIIGSTLFDDFSSVLKQNKTLQYLIFRRCGYDYFFNSIPFLFLI